LPAILEAIFGVRGKTLQEISKLFSPKNQAIFVLCKKNLRAIFRPMWEHHNVFWISSRDFPGGFRGPYEILLAIPRQLETILMLIFLVFSRTSSFGPSRRFWGGLVSNKKSLEGNKKWDKSFEVPNFDDLAVDI
jgi:hypothetical protein